VRDAARQYCQQRLQPRVLMAARHENFDREIMNEMGAAGHARLDDRRLRLPGVNHVSYGWSRARSSASTAATAAR
jgi:glutaryl-CoA dehydrogenase